MTDSLAEALPREQARVREVLKHYEDIQREMGSRVMCGPAIFMIKQSLAAAERAAASGDVVEMLRCYQDLKETE